MLINAVLVSAPMIEPCFGRNVTAQLSLGAAFEQIKGVRILARLVYGPELFRYAGATDEPHAALSAVICKHRRKRSVFGEPDRCRGEARVKNPGQFLGIEIHCLECLRPGLEKRQGKQKLARIRNARLLFASRKKLRRVRKKLVVSKSKLMFPFTMAKGLVAWC